MEREGPDLALLTRRLSEAPPEVAGDVAAPIVAAVLSDVLRDLGGVGLSPREAASIVTTRATDAGINRRRWLLLGAWLLRDDSLRDSSLRDDSLRDSSLRPLSGEPEAADRARDWLANDIKALAAAVDARQVLGDADRREELARRALAALGLRPRGETREQAEDRLKTLDSIERQRVILETRAAQERARKIREEMARKAAEEAAASRYGRE